jgi:hypothetical protein
MIRKGRRQELKTFSMICQSELLTSDYENLRKYLLGLEG